MAEPFREYQMGERVTFTRHLHRRHTYTRATSPDHYGEHGRAWSPEGYVGDRDPAPRQGRVIGVRTLANGVLDWTDDYCYFIPKERFKAYLIAFDLHRRPVLVLPEHVASVPS